ncbi:hypothetical protein D9M71_173090 [compost metagenome]
MVVGEVAAFEDGVDHVEAGLRAVAHGKGDGAVEFDHRGWLDAQQRVVEADDLRPVGAGHVRRRGMHGGNRRLQAVRAETLAGQGAGDQLAAFVDLLAVP